MAQRLAPLGAEHVIAAIRRILDPDVAIASWRPLDGGTGVRSFAFELAGRQVVAKVADAEAVTTLSVEAELRLLEHAASIGVAPRPIGVDRTAGILLYEFVDAAPWGAEDFQSVANIRCLAARLRMLHTLPTGIRPYEPVEFAQAYLERCPAAGRARAEAWYAELRDLAPGLDGARNESVVCHNDLHASNVLRGRELLFIDFEYAAAAPAIVDLASVIAMNRLDARGSDALLDAYYDGHAAPFDRRELANAVRLQELLAELWRLTRAGPERHGADRNGQHQRGGANRE